MFRWKRLKQGLWARWYFRKHTAQPPAMVRRLWFVDGDEFRGVPTEQCRRTLEGEPYWLALRSEGGELFCQWRCEVRDVVLDELEHSLELEDFEQAFLIDRSLLRNVGVERSSHPAFHASFTLWARVAAHNAAHVEAMRLVASEAEIQRDAYVPDRPV